MPGTDPLDVSPYLTLFYRDVRTACRALMRHRGRHPPCGACEISDLCERSSSRTDRVSHRNSPDTLPQAALDLPARARPTNEAADAADAAD